MKEQEPTYDLNTIQGRADAVRVLIKEYFNTDEANDTEFQTHLLMAYDLLALKARKAEITRPLTEEEYTIYHQATYKAVSAGAALTSYISLLHPSVSTFSPTLATDQYMRVSIGWWFFDPSLTVVQRGTLLLHEVMHTVLGHYTLKNLDLTLANKAGDAIINQGIEHARSMFMELPKNKNNSDIFVFPRTIISKKYPKGMPENLDFMAYYREVEKNTDKNSSMFSNGMNSNGGESSQNGNGSGDENGQNGGSLGSGLSNGGNSSQNSGGNGGASGKNDENSQKSGENGGDDSNQNQNNQNKEFSGCRPMSAKEESDLDKRGVEKAGDLEKEQARIASINKAREIAKNNGSKDHSYSGSDFNDFILSSLQPPKIRWEQVLKTVVSHNFNTIITGHTDYSYRRPSRRSSNSEFIRPSTIGYSPSIIVGLDCSGSMNEDDYMAAVSEVDGICKTIGFTRISFITVDTEITSKQVVSKVSDIKLGSGGGTELSPFYKYINSMQAKNRPDVTILITDGGIGYEDWRLYKTLANPKIMNLVLVTNKNMYEHRDKSLESRNFKILPIYKD